MKLIGVTLALLSQSTALVLKQPQMQLAQNKDSKEQVHDLWEASDTKTRRMPKPPNDMPASLRGRNLVIAGDSVDRYAAEWLCKLYYGENRAFNLTKMNADSWHHDTNAPFYGKVVGDGRGGYGCHMEDFNTSLLYLHHPGVMSSPPQPSWHADQNQRNPKRHARLWRLDSGMTVNSSTDLARMYWRQAVEDNLPKRPVILLAQSSLWDSVLAKESLMAKQASSLKNTSSLPSSISFLTSAFSSPSSVLSIVQEWDWIEHASNFLQVLLDTGLPVEKMIWRTNANCPVTGEEAPLINMISQGQANEARRMIHGSQGPWRDVILMDWRKDFNATSPGWCDGIHYSPLGYQTYIQSLWDTLSQQS